MVDQSTNISQIIEVEKSWSAAHLNLDLGLIEEILSENYRQIQPDGSLIGKDELLASYRSGLRSWVIAESDELEIRLLGDTALMIGRWRGKGVNNGHEFDYQARFLAVYHLEEGRWKLISDVSIPLTGSS
jgi:ketosteroid isomerase-like protein